MRKAPKRNRTLDRLHAAERETRTAVQNYNRAMETARSLERDGKVLTSRIVWLETQAKRDQLLIEHLVETVKWSAKKGVQPGLDRN